MAMEMVCGNCHGRLLVEQTGVVVACPHCGAHLQIGEPTPASSSATESSPPRSTELPSSVAPSTSLVDTGPQSVPPGSTVSAAPNPLMFEPQPADDSEQLPEIILTPPVPMLTSPAGDVAGTPSVLPDFMTPTGATNPPLPENDAWMPKIDLGLPPDLAAPPALPAISESSTLILPTRPEQAHQWTANAETQATTKTQAATKKTAERTDIWSREQIENSHAEQPTIAMPDFTGETVPHFSDLGSGKPARDPLAGTTQIFQMPLPESAASPSADQRPVSIAESLPSVTSNAKRPATVPAYLFVIVASYASAITLAFLYLWWRGAVSTLDLPDVVPEFNKSGKYTWKWIQENPLPAAYRLKLGESRRYGNVVVTPLKVTRGPLEFTHFSDQKDVKQPTQPVLKLWMKFENVSTDQTFPALDEILLFERTGDKQNAAQDRTNNYVCQQSERKRTGKRIPVYALPIKGVWNLKDQNLNTYLSPQQTWETYIPTNDEDLSTLEGPLTWRLHFRKGYNPKSFRGVTTLVEVEFDSKDIRAES